jgi:hypothetical protein
MTAHLTTFSTKAELLAVLATAGLAHEYESELHHDQTCVDVFPVWPRVHVEGEWVDDVAAEPKWTANLAMECPDALKPYQAFPAFPKRVFAGD